jgi:uncharacterized membrane protein
MAEIAILRRVREEQERQQMRLNRRPKKNTALLLGGVMIGGYFMYHGINRFLSRNLADSASKGVPFREGTVTASGALLVLGGLSLLKRTFRGSARH